MTAINPEQISKDLIDAAKIGNLPKVMELVSVPGINVNLHDNNGWTALLLASGKGHTKIVQELLAVPGIDVNIKYTNGGWSALMLAANEGHPDIVNILLATPGIQVNLQDDSGYTALMWAASQGHSDIVQTLLAFPGIQVNLKNINGKTALNLTNKEEIRSLLRSVTTGPPRFLYIPRGKQNSIMMNEIEDGNNMVTWGDHKNIFLENPVYYKRSTYDQLPNPKRDPHTREPIQNEVFYKARIIGGRSLRYRRNNKNRKNRKNRKTRKQRR